MHDSWQDSFRDSFFYAGHLVYRRWLKLKYNILQFRVKYIFSLHMHAKHSFAHRLQTAKMASSRTSAQNNGPRARKNGPWV